MISILLGICAIASVVLAALIFLRGRQTTNVLFAAVALCLGLWSLSVLLFLQTNDATSAYLYAKSFYFIAAAFPVFLLMFALIFPKSDATKLKLTGLIIAVGASIALPILILPGFIVKEALVGPEANSVIIDKPTYILFSVFFIIYFYLAIGIALQKYSVYKGNEKFVAGAYAFGLFIQSIPGVVTNLILPYFGNYEYIWVGPVGSLVFLSLTYYSIVKHRMFDLRFYVVRAAAYLLTVFTLSILYIAPVVYLLGIVIMDFPFVLHKFIVAIIVGTLAAASYNLIRNSFDRMTSRIFFRQSYEPEKFIADLNKAVVSNLDLDSLLSKASTVINANIKSEFCAFWLTGRQGATLPIGLANKKMNTKDLHAIRRLLSDVKGQLIVTDSLSAENEELKNALLGSGVALIARLSPEREDGSEGLGFILLGQKKSGDLYNNQDTNTMEIIINGLIIAIQNAMRFEEIQQFNVTLQQKVNDATRQLRKANAKLVALDETKDDFISMASHQLRTPLTSVKGYLSMVLEGDAGEVNPMQKKMLDQAFLSSQRMVFLIADLLNVSRLKTGKFVIERSKIQLQRMIQDEIDQLRETAKARNLTVTFDKPTAFPDVMLDETKTRQVIMNFIDNAIYYTPSGGQITVTLTETPASIEMRVKDNGIGVPKQEQQHLFTKFYRAGNARRARPDGTGLGLFMAKKIIVAQGGAILFDSKEGKGSTFGFVLPKSKLQIPKA